MSKDLLQKHLTSTLDKCLGKTLVHVKYEDVFEKEQLDSDPDQDIHITAMGVYLIFSSEVEAFFQWDRIQGWEQYSLVCRSQSPVQYEGYHVYDMSTHRNWGQYINKRIISYEIWGYEEFRIGTEKYQNQPVLVRLLFEDEISISLANFWGVDFQPMWPTGDDIWILFNENKVEEYLKHYAFDKLSSG